MAANWLRNIQGQLTELATEVLNEAQNEVDDPESELQVEKKKSAEAERLLLVERTRTAELERANKDLSDQLYSSNMEMDAISIKFQHMVEVRDQQIRSLKSEVQQLQLRFEEGEWLTVNDVDSGTLTSLEGERDKLREELNELKQKYAKKENALVEEIDGLRAELENLMEEKAVAEVTTTTEAPTDSPSPHDWGELLENAEQERDKLKEELEELKAKTDRDDSAMAKEIEDLRAELENLKEEKAVAEVTSSIATVAAAAWDDLVNVEEERDQLREELNELKEKYAQKDNVLVEEIDGLRAQLTRLKDGEAPLEARPADDLSNALGELLDTAEQERDKLKEELAASQDECRRLFDFVRDKLPKSATEHEDENMSSADLAKKLGRQEVQNVADRDAEVHHLRMELFELLKSFNELNDEYSTYKEAQSNETNAVSRDFTERIDSLKASLIEYEERYEQCKRENADTVAQLEKLTADFEKLRYGMNCATTSSHSTSASESKMSAENKQLKELLKESMDDKDKLLTDAHKFQSAVNSIDKELEKLRESNRNLLAENTNLRETLNGSRDRVSETSALLGGLRTELNAIRDAGRQREENLGRRVEELEGEKEALEAKLSESAVHDAKLQELGELSSETERKVLALEERLEKSNQQLTQNSVEKEELVNELNLLRDQLLAVQEASSNESASAAERETQLRQKIQMLEEKAETATAVAADTTISSYQLEIAELTEKLQSRETELGAVQSRLLEREESLSATGTALSNIQAVKDNLEADNIKITSERDSLLSELNSLKASLEDIKRTNEQLSSESGQCEELKKALEAKHAESVMYYTKLQELAQLNSETEKKVYNVEDRLAKSNQELALSFEEKEKLIKELRRLREHLVMMEETSTREAIAAEERETQLRKTVRMLEEKTEAATDTVVSSSNQYQIEIAELTEKLESRESELSAVQSRLHEREKSLSDTSKALSNLQIVLKDLSADHEKELSMYEQEMDGLRDDVKKTTVELKALRATASEWDEEKRFIEDTVAMQKEEMGRKDKIVEDLENQIEELRHASAEANRPSHKIDDTVLRQLFLSYFTASKDKQGEIAVLLASVLEYPPEDVATIQHSVQQNSRGWFSWMGGSSAPGAPSITEQFIRFLEHESLAVRQQTALPVESTAARLPLEDSFGRAQPKSSSADLKSILES